MERRSLPRKIKPRKRQLRSLESKGGNAVAEPGEAGGFSRLDLDKKPANEMKDHDEGQRLWPPPVESIDEESVADDSDEPFPNRD